MSIYIRNRMAQPLELHLDSGTVMIGPYAEVEVPEDAAGSPQVLALEKRGQLWVRQEKAESPASALRRSEVMAATTEASVKDSPEPRSKRGAAARKVKTQKSN